MKSQMRRDAESAHCLWRAPATLRLVSGILFLLVTASIATTRADEPAHVFVRGLVDAELGTATNRGSTAGSGTAFVYNGEVVAAPQAGGLRSGEMAVRAEPDARGGEASTPVATYRPDRQTELETELDYFEVFNPSIAPFKRGVAYDAVALSDDGVTPLLTVSRPRDVRTLVPIEGSGAPPPDSRVRDLFWASVVLDFSQSGSSGRLSAPLPSVSPESRVLVLDVTPTTLVRVERDAADNFFAVVEARAVSTARTLRVNYLMDAPQSYFGAPLPAESISTLSDQAFRLPRSVQRRAESVHTHLGLSRADAIGDALLRMTAYFRSFVESHDPPADTGDIYLDLALGRKGVCRHRVYAFMITALGLGIPTRFVQNEAHAWAEVKVSQNLGWMRVDLGGAAAGVRAHDAESRVQYVPRHPDPFPRPDEYARAMTAPERGMTGLRDGSATGVNSRSGSGAGSNATGAVGATHAASTAANQSVDPRAGTAQDIPNADRAGARRRLRVLLEPIVEEARRGASISVRGRILKADASPSPGGTASADAAGVINRRVELILIRRADGRVRPLGVAITRDEGWFQAQYVLPRDLDVGDYFVRALAPGDLDNEPAQSF